MHYLFLIANFRIFRNGGEKHMKDECDVFKIKIKINTGWSGRNSRDGGGE